MILGAGRDAVQRQANGDILVWHLPAKLTARWVNITHYGLSHWEHDITSDAGELHHDRFSYVARRSRSSEVHCLYSHPSRPPFDTLEDVIGDSMEHTGKGYGASRRKSRTFHTTFSLTSSLHSIRRLIVTAIVVLS